MLEAVPTSKVCKGKCGKTLPLDDFGVHPLGYLGRKSKCKACLAEIARQNWNPSEEQREKARQRTKAWNEANPERKAATTKAWAKANPQKCIEAVRRWQAKNPEKTAAYYRKWWEGHKAEARAAAKRWRQEHPKAYLEAQKRWRTENADYWRGRAEVIAKGDLTWNQWVEILAYFDHACAYCRRTDLPLTMDHLVPISKGGPHTQSNVVPACKSCNSKKGAKSLFAMLKVEQQTHTQTQTS